jgi:hypothetical protein
MSLRHLQVALTISLPLLLTACQPESEPAEAPAPVSDPNADARAVEQLIQDIFDGIWSATEAGDTAYITRYHTDDFLLLEHGEIWTNDTIHNWLLNKVANHDPTAPERRNSFDFYRSERMGDHLWVAYQNYGDWVDAAGDTVASRGWLESAVAVRDDAGKWKLKMMHSTRNTP